MFGIARMRPLLLAVALLQMICPAAASNATSRRRRLIAERVALPKPGTGSALEELTTHIAVLERELGKARESAVPCLLSGALYHATEHTDHHIQFALWIPRRSFRMVS